MINPEKEKTTKALAIWWASIAVVTLVIGGGVDCIKAIGFTRTILHAISVILITLGGIFATTGIGVFISDKVGVTGMIKDEIAEIMCNSLFIKRLKKDSLKDLKKKINEELYSKDIAFNEDSLLNYVVKSIEPHIDNYYFEKYSMRVFLKIKSDRIEKTVIRDIVVKPAAKDTDQQFDISKLFCTMYEKKYDYKGIEKPRLVDIRINGKNASDEYVFSGQDNNENDTLDYRIHAKEGNDTIKLPRKGVSMIIVIKTESPKDDTSFVHKLPVASKNYEVEFDYENDKCEIELFPFAFMNKNNHDKFAINKTDSNVKVTYLEWVLPSNGIVFTWKYLE